MDDELVKHHLSAGCEQCCVARASAAARLSPGHECCPPTLRSQLCRAGPQTGVSPSRRAGTELLLRQQELGLIELFKTNNGREFITASQVLTVLGEDRLTLTRHPSSA